jgi:hypothetical protein
MSGTTKAARVRVVETEDAPAETLLDQILSRVDAIAVQQSRPSPVSLRTWEEIERFAEKAARSGMVPKDFLDKPDAICIAVQMGSELGLAPMQALQNIAVVNGRPSLWGDAIPGLIRASGKCQYMKEWIEGEGDARVAYFETKRKDDPNVISAKFSVADAKKAGLWKTEPKTTKTGRTGTYTVDSGPWFSYPDRMMQMRARGFGARDGYPDVLKGLISREEAMDYQQDEPAPSMPQAAPVAPSTPPGPAPFLDRAIAAITKSDSAAKTMALLQRIMPQCPTMEDFNAIRALPLVQTWEKNAPADARESILSIWRAAVDRLSPQIEAESDAAEPVLIQAYSADGEPLPPPLMLPVVFARWFAVNFALATNRLAFREFNQDAIADAGNDPEAANIIQETLDGDPEIDAAAPF